jgi:tetratricopeptide (TPR) repeat protein
MSTRSIALAFVLAAKVFAPPAFSQTPSATDGDALLSAGKPIEARAAFEAALTANPADAQAQAGEVTASERIALDARAAGQTDDALRALLRAADFAPHSARLLLDTGVLEEQMRLYKDAEKAFSAAQQISPSDPGIQYGLARVYMDLDQLDPAEKNMEAYLKVRPGDATAHFGLGRIYQMGLQFDKARTEFARSIELQPVQTEAYFELGDLALKQGDLAEALQQFNKTLARNPKHGGALEGSGEACFKLQRYPEAKDFLERAIAASPEYPPSHYYLGLTLARLGRKEDSERELELSTKLAAAQSKQSSGQIIAAPPSQSP